MDLTDQLKTSGTRDWTYQLNGLLQGMLLDILVKWTAFGPVARHISYMDCFSVGDWSYQLNGLFQWRCLDISETGQYGDWIHQLNWLLARAGMEHISYTNFSLGQGTGQTSYSDFSPEKIPVVGKWRLVFVFVLLQSTKLSVKFVFPVLFKHKNE